MNQRRCLFSVAVLLATSCTATLPPPAPSHMVPSKLGAEISVRLPVYVEEVKLASVAQTRATPFEARAGKFPLTESHGLAHLREAIRMTLASAGATLDPPPSATFILTPIVLGGMTIPFPEAHAVLFVRYELSGRDGGQALWSKNVYSQAKFETRDTAGTEAEATYARLAAGNLRQMAASLSAWHAARTK